LRGEKFERGLRRLSLKLPSSANKSVGGEYATDWRGDQGVRRI
jgi:hypothetical protein